MYTTANTEIELEALSSPFRTIDPSVFIYKPDGTSKTFYKTDDLKSYTIQKVGDETKFYGYGICQKLNLKIRDVNKIYDFPTFTKIMIGYRGVKDYLSAESVFYVTRVYRDENTNELSITAYDAIYFLSQHTLEEVDPTEYKKSITIREFLNVVLTAIPDLARNIVYDYTPATWLSTTLPDGPNIDGIETIRDIFDDLAEATHSIYFVDRRGFIRFKKLDRDGDAVYTIDRDNYFSLHEGDGRRLVAIRSTNPLGDDIEGRAGNYTGTTQVINENMFYYSLPNNIPTYVNNAVTAIGGITIKQYETEWRGCYYLELGDKIRLERKTGEGDSKYFDSYMLNETVEFDGGYKSTLKFQFQDAEVESTTNSTTLGEALRYTFARVDKANQNIEMLISSKENNEESLTQLRLDTEAIIASVSQLDTKVEADNESMSERLTTVENSVSMKMDAESVSIAITEALSDGVECVETSTGYTFDSDGLCIQKSDSEMSTLINEDGMRVSRGAQVTLTASNTGVDAENLHATTYLIIGKNSRFEDYDAESRTGCFWVGGN